jgi:hypothetical protein
MIEDEALEAVATIAEELEAPVERAFMDEEDIKAIIAEEMQHTDRSDSWVAQKALAQQYYDGDLPRPPSTPGRSGLLL